MPDRYAARRFAKSPPRWRAPPRMSPSALARSYAAASLRTLGERRQVGVGLVAHRDERQRVARRIDLVDADDGGDLFARLALDPRHGIDVEYGIGELARQHGGADVRAQRDLLSIIGGEAAAAD